MLETRVPQQQPGVQGLLERISQELSCKAVLYLQSDGQVLSSAGWIEKREIPSVAAIVAAVAAAGYSLAPGNENTSEEFRFHYEFGDTALYAVAVDGQSWLATLYDQPLNPGLVRMKIRRFSETLRRLNRPAAGAYLTPPVQKKPAFFENITDEEIDHLFEAP